MHRPFVLKSLAYLLCSYTSNVAGLDPTMSPNTNSSISSPSYPRECNGDRNTICFTTGQDPAFSKADADTFSTKELGPAAQKARPSDPWFFDGSKMQFIVSDFRYLVDAVACVQFTIREDFTASESVPSTFFTVHRLGSPGEEICQQPGAAVGTGYFGGARTSKEST